MFHVEHIAKNPLFYIFLHNFVVKSLLYCSTWNNTIHINVLSTVFAYYLACSTWNICEKMITKYRFFIKTNNK